MVYEDFPKNGAKIRQGALLTKKFVLYFNLFMRKADGWGPQRILKGERYGGKLNQEQLFERG